VRADTAGEAGRANCSRRADAGLRWALFLLLPIVLIAGGYWYVAGGQVMSTDDALGRSR
jgi:membrane fusion protein (multidrug efflux system)